MADDALVNDFVVSIANVSGIAYTDLFFVADNPFTVGNADGTVEDVTSAPGDFRDAFRIDGTVTVGVNNPLVFESAGVNEIFEPGEVWVFRITNFTGGAPVFDSVGVFAGSSVGSPPSNASIVAILPEPGTLLLLASGLAGLAAARRRR